MGDFPERSSRAIIDADMASLSSPSLARRTWLLCVAALTPVGAWAQAEALRQQVVAAEKAFAASMADRDAAAFARFISAEAVFFTREIGRAHV